MFAHRFKRYESDNATTPLIKSALVFVSPSVGDKLNELSLMDEREYLLLRVCGVSWISRFLEEEKK